MMAREPTVNKVIPYQMTPCPLHLLFISLAFIWI